MDYESYCKSSELIKDISDIYSYVLYNKIKVCDIDDDQKSKMTFSLVTRKNPCFKYDKLRVRTENVFNRTISFIGRIGDLLDFFKFSDQNNIIHESKSNFDVIDESEYSLD